MSDLYCGAEVTEAPVEYEKPGVAETADVPELTDVPGESGMPQNVSQNTGWKATSEEMRREERQRKRLAIVEADFGFIGMLCLAFGLIGTFFCTKIPAASHFHCLWSWFTDSAG